MKNFKNPVISSCCSNITCLTCISKWIYREPSCPNCRNFLTFEGLTKCNFIEGLYQSFNDLIN